MKRSKMFAGLCLGACSLGVFLSPGLIHAGDPAKAAELAKSLNDAQPRGGNSELLAQKWKALVSEGLDGVPAILKAMDPTRPLGLNWLRPALDAVLEKEKATPETVASLESFIKDVNGPGVARRMAFEWLQRIDPAKAQTLVSGFLNDINPELRRDSIAAELLALKSLPKGKAVLDKAQSLLKVTCDLDQVTELAKILKGEGVEIDLQKHYGFLTDWALVGVFENTLEQGFDKPYAVEPLPDVSKSYLGKDGKPARWFSTKTTSPEGIVDLNKVIGKEKSAVAYAWTRVESDKDQEVEIRLGCITSLKVWLNGELVFQRDEYHHGQNANQHIARCKLKKGNNDLVIKVCQNNQKDSWAQNWQFQARFTDFAGYRIEVKQAPLPKVPAKVTAMASKEIK